MIIGSMIQVQCVAALECALDERGTACAADDADDEEEDADEDDDADFAEFSIDARPAT